MEKRLKRRKRPTVLSIPSLCWDRDFSKITRPVDEMTKQGKTIWAQGHKRPHGFAVGL